MPPSLSQPSPSGASSGTSPSAPSNASSGASSTADVVICGAGIAGIATAYALAVGHGVGRVVLVDERPPLTLTSDKSTEAYRNWWAGPDDSMVRFMNRNIDLLEQHAAASDNRFLMNRRGYVYATTNASRARQFLAEATLAEQQGAGPLRVYRSRSDSSQYTPSAHAGYLDHPTGADLFLDHDAIRAHFGWLAEEIVAVLHTRRCGWVSGQQLGMYLLEEAKRSGATLVAGRVESVVRTGARVSAVKVADSNGTTHTIDTPVFVNAAGPFAKQVAHLMDVELPLYSELHLKVAFEDNLGVVDRNTGLVILDDAQTLEWSDDEREELASSEETRWMTEPLPAGIHLRPEGYRNSQTVLMLWDYHSTHHYDAPALPLPDDPFYAEVLIRGMVKLVPGMARYIERLPHSYCDGGYYTKTRENRPLIGPLPVEGAFVCAAFSGYGLMAAPAAGELLAAHVTGSALPSYASSFLLSRYEDAAYRKQLANWGATGQL